MAPVWIAIGVVLGVLSFAVMPAVSYDVAPDGGSDEASRPSGTEGLDSSVEAQREESDPRPTRDGEAETDEDEGSEGADNHVQSDEDAGGEDDGETSTDRDETEREHPSPLPGLPGLGWESGFCDLGVALPSCATDSDSAAPGSDVDSGRDRLDDEGSGVEPFARSSVVDQGSGEYITWAVGAGLFALLAAAAVRLFGFLFAGRFLLPAGWRLDRTQVVSHPVRSAMLAHLEKHPGATTQELADAAEVRHTRAVYHLSILQREECVSQRRLEGRKHFFITSAPSVDPTRLRKRRLARSDRPPARVLDCLARSPGATVSQVARMLGYSPGHAHYHLSRLEKKGLLDRLRRGRRVRHYLTHEGHEIVAESQAQDGAVEMEAGPKERAGIGAV